LGRIENINGEKIMPRLVGKQSNSSWYAGLFLFFAIAAGSLEYFGFINMIPGFGQDRRLNEQSQLQIHP
jgi:hypothetical protein